MGVINLREDGEMEDVIETRGEMISEVEIKNPTREEVEKKE